MGRDTQRGQMIIEMLLLILMFVGLFILAIGMTENGERAQTPFRFSKSQSNLKFKRTRSE